jgi:hypothetical protein
MRYVDILDGEILDIHQVSRKKKVSFDPVSPKDLDLFNVAVLTEEATPVGDVILATQVAELRGDGKWYRIYTVRAFNAQEIRGQAKVVLTQGKIAPLTITVSAGTKTFDLDKESQDNINNTIDSWTAVDVAAGPPPGVISWTLADNTDALVSLVDLQAVKTAATLRGLQLHMDYQAVKAANPLQEI